MKIWPIIKKITTRTRMVVPFHPNWSIWSKVIHDFPKHRQTHRQTDTLIHRQTDTQTNRHTDKQTNRHTDKQTHRQTDTQTNRHTDKQTHRQTDTQTDRHTNKSPLYHIQVRVKNFCPIFSILFTHYV